MVAGFPHTMGDTWRVQIDLPGHLGAFGNADVDAGPASAPVIRAFDAGPPEPRAKLLLACSLAHRRNPGKGIWGGGLCTGCQDPFLLPVRLMDAHGVRAPEAVMTSRFLLWWEPAVGPVFCCCRPLWQMKEPDTYGSLR